MSVKKVLILGGTSEGVELVNRIDELFGKNLDVIISYAGVTGHQPDLPCKVHVGGFKNGDALSNYIEEEKVTHLIDATHPFAAKISQNAYIATLQKNIPHVVLCRPEWVPHPKDKWLEVSDMREAVAEVEKFGVKTFLTIGIKELALFKGMDHVDFVVRMMSAPQQELPLSKYEVVVQRPPYDLEKEQQFLEENKISLLVTKNSGGFVTRAKVDAARALKIPVIMVQRPAHEPLEYIASVPQALQWLSTHGV